MTNQQINGMVLEWDHKAEAECYTLPHNHERKAQILQPFTDYGNVMFSSSALTIYIWKIKYNMLLRNHSFIDIRFTLSAAL